MNERLSPPTWYWVVVVIALIWNGLGIIAYLIQINMTPGALDMLPENEQSLYQNIPVWVTVAFAIAVFAGSLGSLLLLLRKRLAQLLLILSLVGILVQMSYTIFISKAMEVHGASSIVMPIMTIVIAIGLIWLARSAKAKGWIS